MQTCDNAGIGKNVPAEDSSDEDWLRVINVNLNSVFYVWVKEQILRPPKDTPVERHLAGSAGALIPVDRGPSAQTIPAMPKTLTVFEVRDGRDATVGSITVPRSGGIRFETALERDRERN